MSRESDKTRAEIVRQMPKLSPFAVYPYKTEKSPSNIQTFYPYKTEKSPSNIQTGLFG